MNILQFEPHQTPIMMACNKEITIFRQRKTVNVSRRSRTALGIGNFEQNRERNQKKANDKNTVVQPIK
uniref:Uncharacterized protein n=1 Tax=Romanomermis culicivorax TaxID=13658 RepID=A0A915IQ02_ROMCU